MSNYLQNCTNLLINKKIFSKNTKHLYIHIPFCKNICWYCDFFKTKYLSSTADWYIDFVINEIKKRYRNNIFKTIYIGGGTPNCLSNRQLIKLLSFLSLKLDKKYEFTIECRPELLSNDQAKIFKEYKINRVSIGVQILNEDILSSVNRLSTKQNVLCAISNCYRNNINNISCDIIYGFNNQKTSDLKLTLDFLLSKKIKHISCYSLEVKDNTVLGKKKYTVNPNIVDEHLAYIIKYLKLHGFHRYEVSSWCRNKKYQSIHNKAIWLSNDFAGVGAGAYGFENNFYYHFSNNIENCNLLFEKYNKKSLFQHILIMGLRLKQGINLLYRQNNEAYKYFKDNLSNDNLLIKTKNRLYCRNLNLLDIILIKIV